MIRGATPQKAWHDGLVQKFYQKVKKPLSIKRKGGDLNLVFKLTSISYNK
jgi:hypothetical protein